MLILHCLGIARCVCYALRTNNNVEDAMGTNNNVEDAMFSVCCALLLRSYLSDLDSRDWLQ